MDIQFTEESSAAQATEDHMNLAFGEEVNQDEENSVDGEEMEDEVGDNDEFMADNEVRAEESGAEGEARALDEIGEDQEEEEDDDDDDDDYGDDDDDDDEEEERLVENDGGTASVSLGNNDMPLDRLSALPILLLFNILSRLDTREGVITSVLSKRWKHLWLFVPRLKFSYSSVDTEKISRFLAAINRTIIIYNARFLSCFEVEFTYHDCKRPVIYSRVLSMLAMNGWELPQSDRRVLQVSTSCNEESISGIACLLDSSPYVETLGIDGYKPKKTMGGSPAGARHDLRGDLLHLKTIEITIWPEPNDDGEPMLELAEILLKRSKVLERLVVHVIRTVDFVSVIQRLLECPRSSPNAVVLLP
ncbi:hypothetical protein DM860_018197 [Cuscuta australis]|uniref:F-box domain-containing protein n=1 Tax=Cuscuta australis TaxID=267555 RepID=A0A328DDN5_9ASTE|nr:hypothetical protein DM860_018197 [Cuscuta australis]